MTTPQGDSQPDAPGSTALDDTQDVDAHQHDAHQHADVQHDADDQHDDGDQSSREKRYRLRLREAEAERDALQEQVIALRSRVLDNAVRSAGYKSDLAELLDTDALFEGGMLDGDKLSAAIEETAAKFGIARARRNARNALAPNEQQGMRSAPPRPEASWGQIIGDAARRGHG